MIRPARPTGLVRLLAPALLTCAIPAISTIHPEQPASRIALERRLAASVSRAAVLASVRDLAALGPRMGGTPSGDRAAEYVAARMRDLGLGVEVTVDPELDVHRESSWTVELDGAPLTSAWPYGFSPSRARATGPLRADRRAGPEGEAPAPLLPGVVSGAVILTDGPAAAIAEQCARDGALALLTDAPRDPNRFLEWSPIEPIPAALRGAVRDAGMPIFAISWSDGARLRRALQQADAASPARVTIQLDATAGRGRPRSVIGTLPGAGRRADQSLMLCAHGDSDSGGPGADDNASGVAALLEVARALVLHREELPADRPAVRLIVWGAEYHSAEAWIGSHHDELPRLQAVLNYDQCGAGAERNALYYEGNDIPFNAPLLRMLSAIAQDHAGQEGFWADHTSTPALGGTDAYAFLPRAHKGVGLVTREIPATTIFTSAWGTPDRRRQTPGWISAGWPTGDDLLIDYSPWYHSSGDTPERTTEKEPWNMERCARLALLGLYRLMSFTE